MNKVLIHLNLAGDPSCGLVEQATPSHSVQPTELIHFTAEQLAWQQCRATAQKLIDSRRLDSSEPSSLF